jgi:hypothetical protein
MKTKKPKQQIKRYWDWPDCESYLLESKKLTHTQIDLLHDYWREGEYYNGCFQCVYLDEIDDDKRYGTLINILKILVEEFGHNPEFCVWW